MVRRKKEETMEVVGVEEEQGPNEVEGYPRAMVAGGLGLGTAAGFTVSKGECLKDGAAYWFMGQITDCRLAVHRKTNSGARAVLMGKKAWWWWTQGGFAAELQTRRLVDNKARLMDGTAVHYFPSLGDWVLVV